LSEAQAEVLQHHFRDLEQQKDASSLGMWVFLVTEILFFGGMFLVYTVHRYLYYDAFLAGSHHLDWKLGAFNTAVLICSSLTMAMAVHAAAMGERRAIVAYLALTMLLGLVFLGVKFVEYRQKIAPCFADPHEEAARGERPHEGCLMPGERFDALEIRVRPGDEGHVQLYYSLYFGMTGLHATHMIIGIPILGLLAILARRGRFGPSYHTPVELLGLYWHFVDIVWIFLFPLLYLVGHH
jgi:cytochrome c oxidase subunit 3